MVDCLFGMSVAKTYIGKVNGIFYFRIYIFIFVKTYHECMLNTNIILMYYFI